MLGVASATVSSVEKKLLEKGKVTPQDVATLAFRGVREGRFYLLPHPRILKDVGIRMQDILELRNPTRTA